MCKQSFLVKNEPCQTATQSAVIAADECYTQCDICCIDCGANFGGLFDVEPSVPGQELSDPTSSLY